jgi:hypothetical protein
MTLEYQIYQEVKKVTPLLQKDVLDFVRFLLYKQEKTTLFPTRKTPILGCAKGRIWMAEDFDEPLEDFKEYME